MTLRAEFGFNEGTGTPADSSGNGIAFTLGSSVWVTPGHGGSAAALRTTGMAEGQVSPVSVPVTSWTVMCWFRIDSNTGGYNTILVGPSLQYIELDSALVLDWFRNDAIAGSGSLSTGVWYHVAGVVNSATGIRSLYLDGVLVGTSTGGADAHSNEHVSLGGGDGSNMTRDDFRFFDTALTQAQVQTEMNNHIGGSVAPLSASGTLTLTGSATRVVRLTRTAAGTVTLTGSASASVASSSVTTTASGVLTATGTAASYVRFARTAGGTLTASGVGARQSQLSFPAEVAAGGRYFLDESGNPWQLKADSPWSALTDLSPAQWETWCENRAGYGFNAAIVSAVGATDNGAPYDDGRTFDGIYPFVGGDITQPVEAYWSRVDQFFDIAEQYGITMMLYVMDGWNSTHGTNGKVFDNKSQADCQTYGAFLGARYGDRANLMWMLGGDYFPITNEPADGSSVDLRFWAAIQGCRSTESTYHLLSIQLGYNRSWSTQNPFWGPKVDWNFVYSYFPQYEALRAAYADVAYGVKPAPFSEGHYENGTHSLASSAAAIRRQAGWAYSSGSPGDIYGTNDWKFDSGWETRLNPAGVADLQFMRDAAAVVAWWKLAPRPSFITAGAGTAYVWDDDYADTDIMLDTYATAAVATDGSLAVVYMPTSRAISVDLSLLGASPTGYRVDPTTGTTTAITPSSITAPGNNAAGQSDWLYVFQATAVTPTVTATGTLTLSGSAVRAIQAVTASTGSLTLAGTAVQVSQLTRTATGSLGLAGTAAQVSQVTRTAAGSLTLSGTATGEADGGTVTVTAVGELAAAGGAVVGNTAPGSLSLSGGGASTVKYVLTAADELTLAGLADGDVAGGALERAGDGELTLAGSAAYTLRAVRLAASELLLSGQATAAAEGGSVELTAEGELTVSGTADASTSGPATRAAAGELSLSGSAQSTAVLERTAAGTLELAGVGAFSETLTRLAQGTMTLAGTAAGYSSEAPPIPTGKLRLKVRGAGYTLIVRSVDD